MRHLAVLAVLAVQVTVAGVSVPWDPVPDGWIYLDLEQIDSWPGLFHDTVSGACILFDVTFPFVVTPVHETTADVPLAYSGVPVRYVDAPNELCPQGRTVQASFFPQGDNTESIVWNTHSETCGATQYERVREFMFLIGGQPREQAKDADRGRLHTRSELESVSIGRSFASIRKELGATSWAECHRDGSFTAVWTEGAQPQYLDWKFRFDQNQKLLRKGVPH